MTTLARQSTVQVATDVLHLALRARRFLEQWEALRHQHAARADQPCRYYLGQRVRTTVDELSLWGSASAPAGTLGIIAMPEDEWGDYAVILDSDPSGRLTHLVRTSSSPSTNRAPADDLTRDTAWRPRR
ncbi:hypothetical protein [Streptomyces sp. NPDC058092]|uniref:hypothetical protein n=1 Tax=Streptomyces sp. NPDC058092 TaxID=3346336 RepID=UPI0036F0F9A9